MKIIDIKVPTIGESVTEVTLASWLKADGSWVQMDEPICEFESDKATLELPAEAAGRLIHVAAEGDDLKIGDIVARIDTSADSTETVSKPDPARKSKTEPATNKEKVDVNSESAVDAPNNALSHEIPASYASGVPSPAAGKILAENGIDPD